MSDLGFHSGGIKLPSSGIWNVEFNRIWLCHLSWSKCSVLHRKWGQIFLRYVSRYFPEFMASHSRRPKYFLACQNFQLRKGRNVYTNIYWCTFCLLQIFIWRNTFRQNRNINLRMWKFHPKCLKLFSLLRSFQKTGTL